MSLVTNPKGAGRKPKKIEDKRSCSISFRLTKLEYEQFMLAYEQSTEKSITDFIIKNMLK